MTTTLTALAIVAIGYILAYLVFERLRDRFGYAGGAEYIVIGIILGPYGAGLLTDRVVADLTPIISLALGWLGMHLGFSFRLRELVLLKPAFISIAFTEAILAFAGCLIPLLLLFRYGIGYPWEVAAVPAVALATIGTVTSPEAIDAQARRQGASEVLTALQLSARIDALVGVVAFGLLLSIFHVGDVQPSVRAPTATEWAVINLAIGVASGILFHLYLGRRGDDPDGEESESRLFVAITGAIVIASGASYFLNFSPIYTNLILGFILANTGNAHRDADRLLARTERPIYLALLIFAGAAWSPPRSEWLFVVPAFIGIRLVARYLSGRVAGEWAARGEFRVPEMGTALLAQGGLGVALALNYRQVHAGFHSELILTAALLSVLIFEFIATRETARVLGSEAVTSTEPAASSPPSGEPGPA